MAELWFVEGQNQQRSGFRAGDFSPDSVIFTAESNFSLFSSASGSVDRCSFASDLHDHDSLVSELSQHLGRHDLLRDLSSGPDSDPNKPTVHRNSRLIRKVEKEETDADKEDNIGTLESARHSSSQAVKECQDWRSRSEALLKRPPRRRHASLDLNSHITNATSSSPRFEVMKKSSVLARQVGMFPSPGTPNYRQATSGIQKGWSSERVPLHTNGNQRQVGAALLPFNNGRTLPSKWEDAERWIFSPLSSDDAMRSSVQQPQRKPKAKSGPLGPPGIAYNSLYSPGMPMFGGNVGNLMAGSPFSAGATAADSLSIRSGAGSSGAGIHLACTEPCIGRSVTVHGCSELQSQSSLPGSRVEKLDDDKDGATNISRTVSRRDMATQMSPKSSPESSPRRRPSFSHPTPSVPPIMELENVQSSKSEVRDVQVDERVTVTRWSKKHKARFPRKGSENVSVWKKKAVEVHTSPWEVSEAAKSISKMKRKEAKITAWENLQKAKAEAAIRKLEVKLETKRSTSMDNIMKKLRSAQKKAQLMRSSVSKDQSRQVPRTSHKVARVAKRPKQFSRTKENTQQLQPEFKGFGKSFGGMDRMTTEVREVYGYGIVRGKFDFDT